MNARRTSHYPRRRQPQFFPLGSTGLARALSKLGVCSRNNAWELIKAGRVQVNGQVVTNPEQRVDVNRDRFAVNRQPVGATERVYLMLNKPRGLVTTAADERGRATVFECLTGKGLPFLAPVGRLDKASEGLLLLTNDSEWAAHITDPAGHIDKTYHVQINCVADATMLQRLETGIQSGADFLRAKRARLLRHGQKNSWLEIILDEGKNRHIRRLIDGLNAEVLRLIRVAVGPLQLGALAKGDFRRLQPNEVQAMRTSAISPARRNRGSVDSTARQGLRSEL